jgi:hypothetical protein
MMRTAVREEREKGETGKYRVVQKKWVIFHTIFFAYTLDQLIFVLLLKDAP